MYNARMDATFTLVLEPIEDGWWLATIPEVPGAVSQGATQDEARAMVLDAMREVLAASRERALREKSARALVETLRLAA